MKLTILSRTETRKAIVEELDSTGACLVRYYRRQPSPVVPWALVRTTEVPGPFHMALNIVHDIVNSNTA